MWAVVLAGGDGRRVAHLTRDGAGRPVPKQFWRMSERGTMLGWALARARRVVHPARIAVVVADRQSRWWRHPLRALPPENVLAQPANLGTAVAMLHAVSHVVMAEPAAIVLTLPTDHYVEDEEVFFEAVGRAIDGARRHPEHLMMLGAEPDHAETEYGWVMPAGAADHEPWPVERFVEKPERAEAERLLRCGARWNTFVLAFRGWALIHAFQRAVPDLVRAYLAAIDGGRLPAHAARAAYPELPARDLGHDVLERLAPSLRLVALPPCGWADLGTPERLARWLASAGAARGREGAGATPARPPGEEARDAR